MAKLPIFVMDGISIPAFREEGDRWEIEKSGDC